MKDAVLCFDLQIKSSNAPVKEHTTECHEYRDHQNNTETMFWSEPMPENLAEDKGRFLANRLGVNYKKAECCH